MNVACTVVVAVNGEVACIVVAHEPAVYSALIVASVGPYAWVAWVAGSFGAVVGTFINLG